MPITARVERVTFRRSGDGEEESPDIDQAWITYTRTGTSADGETISDEKTRAVALTAQEVNQFRQFLSNVKARL